MMLLALAACGPSRPDPLDAPIPAVCEDQVYADPVVKDLIMKGAGTEYFRINHVNQLKAAKQDASLRCQQQKGLAPPGGGVERPRVTG
jgi:hypothetical protein